MIGRHTPVRPPWHAQPVRTGMARGRTHRERTDRRVPGQTMRSSRRQLGRASPLTLRRLAAPLSRAVCLPRARTFHLIDGEQALQYPSTSMTQNPNLVIPRARSKTHLSTPLQSPKSETPLSAHPSNHSVDPSSSSPFLPQDTLLCPTRRQDRHCGKGEAHRQSCSSSI
jgi:hypothetical protein